MRRREFITLLGGVAVSSVLPVRAQPRHIPRVGVVWIAPQAVVGPFHDAFLEGLRELGYVEGQTIFIEARFAQGKLELLPRNRRRAGTSQGRCPRCASHCHCSIPEAGNDGDPDRDGKCC